MSAISTADSSFDVEITENHLDFLRAAGASDALIRVVKFDAMNIGVSRNSAKEEIQKYIEWGELDPENDPADFRHLGGHFFSALWDGDLFTAFCRADGNNAPILLAVFDEDQIIGAAVRRGQPRDYATRLVGERAERYMA